MTRNWISAASRTLRMVEPRAERPRRRGAVIALESLEVRLALSSMSAAPVPADLNPQPPPPRFVAEVRSLTPDISVTKDTDWVGTHSGVGGEMRKAGGGNPDLVFSPDPINLVRPDRDFSKAPDIQGGHIGTNIVGKLADTTVAGQHGKPCD
jgi:hypothetical protein